MDFDGFDWDAGNRAKCQKHGVSLAEIEDLFLSGPGLWPDLKNSVLEQRTRAIGKTAKGRWIFAVSTIRFRSRSVFILPISARYMHAKEVAHYEKAQAASRSHER
jgi:uncharacterized DUF497 family protein